MAADQLIILRNEAAESLAIAEYTHDMERMAFYRDMLARINDLRNAACDEFDCAPPRR